MDCARSASALSDSPAAQLKALGGDSAPAAATVQGTAVGSECSSTSSHRARVFPRLVMRPRSCCSPEQK
jgi:hypothetical protein